MAGTALVVAALALNAGLTWRDYAVGWSQHLSTRFMYRADMADLARYLNARPTLEDVAASTSTEELVLDARGLRIDLTRSPAQVRLFNPQHALVLPAGSQPCLALISEPPPAPHVERYLSQHSTPFDTGPRIASGPAFQIYTARQAPIPANTFGLPMTLRAQISLLDVHIERLPERVARVRTTWRVEPGAALPDSLRLFAHLRAPDGTLLFAGDRLDVLPSSLRAGDQFLQWNDLVLPEGDLTGCRVAVGLYERDGARWTTASGADGLMLDLK
jgi:hypothetical protein